MPEPDVTENYIRIRVKDPSLFVEGSFKTITISEDQGIKSVIGKLKSDPEGSTVIQNYMFEKDKGWDVQKAEAWVEKHKRQAGMERRSFDGNLRISIDNKVTTLSGTAIPYNRLSVNPIEGLPNIKERILPGAFRNSVGSASDIMMLWNHEMKFVFGRTSRDTLRLKEDQAGVTFENVPPDAQWVKDLIPSIKRGDISNMSFKFSDNVEPSWTKEKGGYVRNVRDAMLYEISVVTFPVYESTSVYARSSELMIVDGVVLPDLISEERKVEAELDNFKLIEEKFNNLKKIWL